MNVNVMCVHIFQSIKALITVMITREVLKSQKCATVYDYGAFTANC